MCLSPQTIETRPFCPVFTRCGGCSVQHMRYEAQLDFKTARVREIFDNAGLGETLIHPALGMENPFRYRNKAQYPVGLKKGVPQLGFYASHSHEIVEHEECRVQPPIVDKIVAFLRTYFLENDISIYDERIHHGLLRHVADSARSTEWGDDAGAGAERQRVPGMGKNSLSNSLPKFLN